MEKLCKLNDSPLKYIQTNIRYLKHLKISKFNLMLYINYILLLQFFFLQKLFYKLLRARVKSKMNLKGNAFE